MLLPPLEKTHFFFGFQHREASFAKKICGTPSLFKLSHAHIIIITHHFTTQQASHGNTDIVLKHLENDKLSVCVCVSVCVAVFLCESADVALL